MLDWKQYWFNYSDLREAGIHSKEALENHWNFQGKKENRTDKEVVSFPYQKYWLQYTDLRRMIDPQELKDHYFYHGYHEGRWLQTTNHFDFLSFYRNEQQGEIFSEKQLGDLFMNRYALENHKLDLYIRNEPISHKKYNIPYGIGDLLILGQMCQLHPQMFDHFIFYLDKNVMWEKNYSHQYLDFVFYILKKLEIRNIFWKDPNQDLQTWNFEDFFPTYPIYKNNLSALFQSVPNPLSFSEQKYIVLNVNSRLYWKNYHNEYDFQTIAEIINTTAFSCPVVVIGSRISEDTTSYNIIGRKYNYSLYPLLDKNKTWLVDRTYDIFLSDFPQKDSFEKDMRIIQDSFAQIQIGLGGSLCFSSLFGNNLIAFLEMQRHILPSPYYTDWLERIGNACFCKTLEDFKIKLNSL